MSGADDYDTRRKRLILGFADAPPESTGAMVGGGSGGRYTVIAIGPYEIGRVFQRADGRWIGKWRARGERNWHQRVCAESIDQAQAASEIARYVRRLAEGTEAEDDQAEGLYRTFGAFVERHHLRVLKETGSRSHGQYDLRWRLYGRTELGPLAWSELTPLALQAWVVGLRARLVKVKRAGASDRALSSGWVHSIYEMVSAALAHAVALKLLPFHPGGVHMRRWLPARAPSVLTLRKKRALSWAQCCAFFKCRGIPKARRVEAFAHTLLLLRPGEVRGLLVGALRLDVRRGGGAPWARIDKSYAGPPKGRRGDVPVHPQLATVLRAWLDVGFVELVGRAPEAADPVFPVSAGTMRRTVDNERLATQLERAGLPRITYHGFRHSGATAYTLARVDRFLIKSMMRHRGGAPIEHAEGEPAFYDFSTTAGDITSVYTRWTIPTGVDEIAKLRVPDDVIDALVSSADE